MKDFLEKMNHKIHLDEAGRTDGLDWFKYLFKFILEIATSIARRCVLVAVSHRIE